MDEISAEDEIREAFKVFDSVSWEQGRAKHIRSAAFSELRFWFCELRKGSKHNKLKWLSFQNGFPAWEKGSKHNNYWKAAFFENPLSFRMETASSTAKSWAMSWTTWDCRWTRMKLRSSLNRSYLIILFHFHFSQFWIHKNGKGWNEGGPLNNFWSPGFRDSSTRLTSTETARSTMRSSTRWWAQSDNKKSKTFSVIINSYQHLIFSGIN